MTDMASECQYLQKQIEFLTAQNMILAAHNDTLKQQIDRYDCYINLLLKNKYPVNHVNNNNDRVPLMRIFKENLSMMSREDICKVIESAPCCEKIANVIENAIYEGKIIPSIKSTGKNFTYLDDNKNMVTVINTKFADSLCIALLDIFQPMAKELHIKYEEDVLSDNSICTDSQMDAETQKDDNRHNNIMLIKEGPERVKIIKLIASRIRVK